MKLWPVSHLCAALTLASVSVAAQPSLPPWSVPLQSAVVKETRRFDGELAVVVKDLGSGQRYTYNAATPMYLASGIKILVLIAVFEAEHEGSLSLGERLTLTEDDVRDGAARLKKAKPGDSFSVMQLVEHMMQKSDNMATDLLMGRVGVAAVNAAAQRYGGPDFGPITTMLEVRRSVFRSLDLGADQLSPAQVAAIRNQKSLAGRARKLATVLGHKRDRFSGDDLWAAHERFYDGLHNSAPLEAVARLLEGLATGQVVSADASARMIEILKTCRTGKRRLRAGLPESVALAHKTGTQVGRLCDLGILYPESGAPVVIAACAKNFSASRKVENLIARVTRAAYASVIEGRGYQAAGADYAGQPAANATPAVSGTVAHPVEP
ncbi:MAG: serine hydrolase [Pseudomonadota bacterium]